MFVPVRGDVAIGMIEIAPENSDDVRFLCTGPRSMPTNPQAKFASCDPNWRITRTNASAPDPLAQRAPGVFAALAAKLGFDEFYAATVGRLNDLLAALAQGLDRWVFGSLVNFLAELGVFSGTVNRQVDEDTLNDGFDTVSASIRDSGRVYSKAQTGEAHGYLRVIAVAFIVLALVLVMGGAR